MDCWIEICFQCLFTYLYKRLSMFPRIYDIPCKISCDLEVRSKDDINCCLDLVVYDDSIGITIEDNCITHTFLIDTSADYIRIFHSLLHIY